MQQLLTQIEHALQRADALKAYEAGIWLDEARNFVLDEIRKTEEDTSFDQRTV